MSVTDGIKRFIYSRRQAYNQVFRGPLAEVVLADLANFCRAVETTFHPDARVSALQEGRREVFLRIQQHLNLSPDELFSLVTGEPQRRPITTATNSEE